MIKNYLLKTVNKYVKEYFENIDDMEYGLLKGEVKMKNTFFKENALKKITSLLLKKSKIEEIDVKYNWSLFGEATVFVKLQNVLLNLHLGGTIEASYDKTPSLDIKNININIDIHNLIVNFDDFTLKISHLSFVTSELISRKAVKVKGITLHFNDKKVLYIPSIEGDVSFNEIIKLCVFIRMIRLEIDTNIFEIMLKYCNSILNGTYFTAKEPKRKNKINLVCNIRSILIDLTDIGKRIYFNTTSLALTKKIGFLIERIRGFDICYLSRFKSKIKHFRPKNMLNITSFSLDKNIYTVKHCFIDHKLIASLDPYCKIVQSCQISCKTNKDDKVTFIIKDCNILVDFYEILMSNCLLEIYIHESLFRTKLSVDSLLLDDFLKAESVKIGYENNKIYSESVSIFLNLEELNLKRAYRSYLKYCVGEGSLDVDFMGHLSNLKIVYGPKTKLIDVENLIIDYNSLNNSGKTPLLSIETDSKCIFEVFNYKNNTICCLSELFFDLKVLKKFNNDFLLPRENDINYIIKHFKSVKKAHECKPKVYLYNINLGYEELRLNIEFFEFNSIINTIFTVFLDDGNHIIVDSAKVKLVVGDILQFQITNNVRINITNSILKKINRFFVDIKNIIILSIKEDEDSNSSISWILDIDSISFNVFDMNLNEILAIYILKTKICNVKEHGGDETVRKLYLKINDIQIDNQVIKNTYPVLLYKTKSNDIIEGNLLYYYNNSTLFIKKTDLKFEEMRLNIEGKHLENILEVYKVENVESTSLKTNVESFMNTCVTVKDFHISDLSVKINYLMKSGDNLKDKMLFFVMNNISDFNLSIDKLNISHYRTDMNGLFDIVYGFYKNEIYNNLFKVFGHIDLLGNVGTLTNTISGTIKENVKKKTGFFKGSKILLKNTFLGVTNTLGKISTSVKNNASLLTFDKEFADTSEFHPYAYDVHLPLPFKQNENNLNLIMKGTEKLISSVYSGVLGVAKKPYDGSASGVGGVIVGLGKGVIGAISKPVVGASELFSNCVQCMGGGPVVIRRMMYPMYTVDKIDKYDIDQASSFYIFVTFLNKLEGEEFIDGSFGHFRGECLLILTNLRLIVSTEISIFEFDPFEIDIDTREMNKFIICKEEVTVNKKRFIKNLCEFLM